MFRFIGCAMLNTNDTEFTELIRERKRLSKKFWLLRNQMADSLYTFKQENWRAREWLFWKSRQQGEKEPDKGWRR